MLRGYRYVIAAVVVWEAFVGVASLHCAFARTEQVKRKDDGKRQVTAVGSTAPVFYLREPEDPGCMPGKEDRRSELCAQWKAVDAAAAANQYAVQQNTIAIKGLWLGILTTVAAILAALYAKNAADIARDVAQSNFRAFLIFNNGNFDDTTGDASDDELTKTFKVFLLNEGRTSASMSRAKFTIKIGEEDYQHFPFTEYVPVKPQLTECFSFQFTRAKHFWNSLSSSSGNITIYMYTEYADIYGKAQNTSIHMRAQADGEIEFVHCEVGIGSRTWWQTITELLKPSWATSLTMVKPATKRPDSA